MNAPGVTAVVINFRTPDLTRRAVESFRSLLPALPLLLIDNGSDDESGRTLEQLRSRAPGKTTLILNRSNRHHGPAMDQALRTVDTPFVFFLDSDCEVFRGASWKRCLRAPWKIPAPMSWGKRSS